MIHQNRSALELEDADHDTEVAAPDARLHPTADEASSGSPSAGSSEAINTLFGLLREIESVGASGKLVVRTQGGPTVGALRLHGGRIYRASGRAAHVRLGTMLADAVPEVGPHLDRLARLAKDRGCRLGELAVEEGLLSVEQVQTQLRRQFARELMAIARASDAGSRLELFRLSHAETVVDSRLTFSPLELFLEVSGWHDTLRADAAQNVFTKFASSATAALLLLRPTDGGLLPVPVACQGLEGATITDLLPICLGAREMCQPAGLGRAEVLPQLVTVSLGDSVWVCGSGVHRYVLLRMPSPRDAARVLGWSLSQLGKEQS